MNPLPSRRDFLRRTLFGAALAWCLPALLKAATAPLYPNRIPHWSRSTRVRLNGRNVNAVQPASYLVLERTWKRGDTIAIDFDFTLQYWVGERECANRVSIYRGPLLLTYERRFNEMDPDQMPGLNAMGLRASRP